jgi:hypothetical protein
MAAFTPSLDCLCRACRAYAASAGREEATPAQNDPTAGAAERVGVLHWDPITMG